MSSLFNLHQLNLKINEAKIVVKPSAVAIFSRWHNLLSTAHKTEEQLQADFLNDIFGEVLGYAYKRGETETNLEKEQKTELDGQKPDGVLGFFTQTSKDIRVIIELKDSKTNLDSKQNRKNDNRTAVEQAFGYVAKYQGIEFVIVSNFTEIRLYQSNYQGKYHSFFIADLACNQNKLNEFHFLLAKDRLFTKQHQQSPVHLLNTTNQGIEIEKKFYAHYSALRYEIWQNLIALNQHQKYGRNFYLYKAQKLIDRIIFIRFCKENGALNNDAVLDALNNKYTKGKYNRLKLLFSAMDEGNPEIGIAKFNGGLFSPDSDLDILNISDEIIDKIVLLYSYDFGSDLDVNILGHIFEQSISDLENLTGNQQQQRKKDGVFYTPAYITQYIVQEAVGGWLADKQTQIKAKQHSYEWWQQYADHLKSIKVLDPACGSGAFLVKVFDYLQQQWQEIAKHININYSYHDILTNNLYGVDINPASVGITKLSLWLKTAHHRQPLTTLDGNIKIGNSLIDDPDIAGYYSEFEGKIVAEVLEKQGELLVNQGQIKQDKHDIDSYFKKSLAFKWKEEFEQVFATGGFDVVVGNPPYGADIDKDAEYFAKHYPNSTQKYKDSYKIFIDKALQIAKSRVGFIVPNTFLYQPRYADIKKIINNFGNNIINLGEDIFENVELPTAILLINKQQNSKKIADLRNSNRNEIAKIITSNSFALNQVAEESVFLQENIKRLDEVLELKDAGFKHQRIRVGKNATKSDLRQRLYSNTLIENSIPLYTGSDADRYFVGKPSLFLRKNYKEILKKGESVYFGKIAINNNPKIVWRQTADKIRASILTGWIANTLQTCIIKNIAIKDYYIISILNSKYYTFLYTQKVLEAGKVFPQVKLAYLKDLPFPVISPQEQQPFIEKAQAMLDLTKQLNNLSGKFLKLLSADLAVAKISKKLEKWHSLNTNEFFAEVGKQNKSLALLQKSQWLEHFETQQQQALALQKQINQTDAKIDQMVYALYNLTKEEIAMIENQSKDN
jgi:hypothetical protein